VFETLELGRKIKRKDFNKAALKLREELLGLQFELETRDFPVIIIVSGVEGAGRGQVVHRLNEWMDPRLIETFAFWDHSDEEETRPFSWRFWRAMPSHGRIGIFFGSWYTRPILQRALGKISDPEFTVEMQRIVESERMFTDDGTLLIKLWFHLPADAAAERARLDRMRDFPDLELPVTGSEFYESYDELKVVSERAIRATDTGHSPWHLIEAQDDNYRDLTAGQTVHQCLKVRLNKSFRSPTNTSPISLGENGQPTILDRLDMDAKLESEEYRESLEHYQARLENLAWLARRHKVPCVALFEGWDAAGKGSAIRRITQAIDPRLFKLYQFAAPTDEEAAHHYLWRFWRELGRDGSFTLFDRSWYGRVLVERVEEFATESEWQRAYGEINRFEEQLSEHGAVLLKFWLHVTRDEQLKRFKEREETPHKQHKITEEDWRNREKWQEYAVAVHDMVTHTSTSDAPWTLVAGNDKRHARIHILRTFCEQLEKGIEQAQTVAAQETTP
jgi:polyphosphate:AMP phosphotransferase